MGPNIKDTDNLLSIASLFRESFSIDWLLELTGVKASTGLKKMEEALEAGLLIQAEPGIYRFIDPKQREKLQALLPARLSKGFEHRIVDIYLRESPEDNIFTDQIATHLINIENSADGCRWLLQAGLAYKKAFRRNEAQRCFLKVLEDIENIEGEEADRLYVQAAIEYSKSVDFSDHISSAFPVLKRALKLAERLKDPVSTAAIEIHLCNVQWFRGHNAESYGHYEKASRLLKTIKDPDWQRSFTILKIIVSTVWGRYREALVDHEKLSPDVAKYPRYWHSFRGAIYLGVSLCCRGNIAQGLGLVHSIRNHCRKMGNLTIACEAGLQLVNILIDIRDIDKAVHYIEETIDEAIDLKNDLLKKILYGQLAYCRYLLNEHEQSVTALKEGNLLDAAEMVAQPVFPFVLELAWAMDQKKYPTLGNYDLQALITHYIGVLNVDFKGVAYRLKALTEAKAGKPREQVLKALLESQHFLEMSGHKTELVRTRIEIRRHYLAVKDQQNADRMQALIKDELVGIDTDLIPKDIAAFRKVARSETAILSEILRLSREIASIRDIKKLVQQIISAANRITGAERGAIFLVDAETKTGRMKLRASRTLTDQDVREAEFDGPMAMIRQTAETGKGCVKIFQHDPEGSILDQKAIHSCICVPMIIRDKVVGVMYHDNSFFATNFKENDLEILSHFAAQAAIAIDNAQAYSEVKRLNRNLKEEKEYYKEKVLEHVHFKEIVGKSQAIMAVLDNIQQVAATDATVLILGETGVGKELVARAVHAESERKNGPFIRVHCSALPESLISSELFGHEKGAFTGASQQRIGRFELADNGTLFLDEIGELPMEIQVHLLRVLQTGEFERVGGSRTIRSNFRLILATNRNLEKEVLEKRFRQDLFYRINVFPITVPPLRARREDIPLLAAHFLGLYGERLNKPGCSLRQKEVRKLMEYDWRGNVRELENVIERAMILSKGSELILPTLKVPISIAPLERAGGLPTLKENERQLIIEAIKQTNGKIQGKGGAAELLDINPHTLKSRMRKLDINRNLVIA